MCSCVLVALFFTVCGFFAIVPATHHLAFSFPLSLLLPLLLSLLLLL